MTEEPEVRTTEEEIPEEEEPPKKVFGEPGTVLRQHVLERLTYILGAIENAPVTEYGGRAVLLFPHEDALWLFRVANYYLYGEKQISTFLDKDGRHYRKANSIGLFPTNDEIRQFDEDDAKATPRDWGKTARDPNSAEEEGKDKAMESLKKKGFFARLFG